MFGIFVDGSWYSQVKYDRKIFSGGEVQITLEHIDYALDLPVKITISAQITNSDEMMELMLVTDAVKRSFTDIRSFVLILPYLPYARQDRVMIPGQSLSVAVVAKMINSLKFDKVQIWDCHSPVGLALIDKVQNTACDFFVKRIAKPISQVLVAPDAGAIKKISDCAMLLDMPYITAGKHRDVKTGAITGTIIHDSHHIGDKDFLIVDDICDGGRTFIELAKVLRPLTNGRILLYVTHAICSKGLGVFEGIIDHIYTARAFPNIDLNNPIITEIP